MTDRVVSRLQRQGFGITSEEQAAQISRRARWTPISCAVVGALGICLAALGHLALRNASSGWNLGGWYFIVLGALTLTGGFSSRSIFDRFYVAVIRPIFATRQMPRHGAARRFGCAIGGTFYLIGGAGFFLRNIWLALIPAIIMIVLAGIAGTTHWCFASALYKVLFGRKAIGVGQTEDCCS